MEFPCEQFTIILEAIINEHVDVISGDGRGKREAMGLHWSHSHNPGIWIK